MAFFPYSFLTGLGRRSTVSWHISLKKKRFRVSGMDDFQKQALTEHLRELRRCLIYSLLATVVGFSLCYSFSTELGQLLFKPLDEVMPAGSSLIFTSYQEGFFFI
jgi:Sec-independent protein secretion pathway component TatC